MKITDVYKLAIDLGIKNDLRGPKFVKDKLKREKKKYESLKGDEKKNYDKERLLNPYTDSRIAFSGRKPKEIKRAMIGVDIDTAELLVADKLSEKKPIDLVIAHHPVGLGLVGLSEVVEMQAELISIQYGVPINIAQNLVTARVSELTRAISPINHYKVVDSAKHLDIPLMCIHTPTDNLVASYLQKKLSHIKEMDTVADVMKIIKAIPEYAAAMKDQTGPSLFAGKESNYAGKIAFTEVTGGTSGSKLMYEKLAQAGIGTIIGMHMDEEYKKEAEKHHINVVIAGHMSSDSLGINLFADELEKKGVEVVPTSGFIRISRIKK